jgi:hypothetical protein
MEFVQPTFESPDEISSYRACSYIAFALDADAKVTGNRVFADRDDVDATIRLIPRSEYFDIETLIAEEFRYDKFECAWMYLKQIIRVLLQPLHQLSIRDLNAS